MKRVILVIPHSHTWLWTQTCVASLIRNPPRAEGYLCNVVVVDNSPWSPAIRGITETRLGDGVMHVVQNHKTNRFHASALDCIVERFEFDYLMAWETDVLALRPDWLEWFLSQMRVTDYAVGAWHHEQFINPSCTLYRGRILKQMDRWCKGEHFDISKWEPRDGHPSLEQSQSDPKWMSVGVPRDELRWGQGFGITAPLDPNLNMQLTGNPQLVEMREWIASPFAEKRGWPEGTVLKEPPSGQLKGPGWYEPGQQLHHWAVEAGHTYTVCPTMTTKREDGLPLQTMYGTDMPDPHRQLEAIELMVSNYVTAHLWGGTRALDILKHEVTCGFVRGNTPMWLEREARFWREVVPKDVQEQTLDLIRRHGWHITGQGSDHVSDRDREASAFVRECYARGGVTW